MSIKRRKRDKREASNDRLGELPWSKTKIVSTAYFCYLFRSNQNFGVKVNAMLWFDFERLHIILHIMNMNTKTNLMLFLGIHPQTNHPMDHSKSNIKKGKHIDITMIGPSVFILLSVCLSVFPSDRPSEKS